MAAAHLIVYQLVHDQDGKAVFLVFHSVLLYVHRDRTYALRPQRPYRCFTSTETVHTVMDGQVFLGFFAGW